METGYFFCGDLLGFGNVVKNLTHEDLDKKISDWTRLVEECANKNNIEKFQLVSDTVFAGVGKEKEDLQKIVSFARDLLNKGILKSLPVRGGISFGKYNWGQLVYGEAVIKAHELEKKQNWIGVTIDAGVNLFEKDCIEMNIVLYAPPMPENNLIMTYYVIAWEIPRLEELSMKLTDGGLTRKGEPLNWNWGNKLGNTTLFSLYLRVLKDNGKQPHLFHGLHPLSFMDAIFNSPIMISKSIK